MDFTVTFVKVFFIAIQLAMPLLLTMSCFVAVLGWIVGRKEGWTHFDSLYWAFITATTVGFGDIRPIKKLSRFLAVMIAFTGIIFTGIVVSLAVEATSIAYKKHDDAGRFKGRIEEIG